MNQLLTMSIGGSSYYQQVNASEAERARKLARSVDLDLNNPPPSEIVALAGPSGVQSQQHSSDSPDDECLIISPGKFEERNPSRRVRSNIEDFTEADFFTWGFAFGRLQTVDGVVPLNDEVLNKTKDIQATSIPVTPIEPLGEPEAPALSCAICMGQLVEETSTKCGHIFCKTCIEKAIATQHKCPNCRRKLRKRDIFRVHLPYTS
uniref:LON peptidase N-terminal domain and RING finger protein 3-like isoform X2 n=1 Tax=Fragaria vesca subsp. vesca TaxID=101020 RepID=UPI0005CB54CF|nr:PREDICTED: LON peptidase N-terminal domain and RING finger protein 3-like isoform X2 [Fragaria vesca subsp. vesca]